MFHRREPTRRGTEQRSRKLAERRLESLDAGLGSEDVQDRKLPEQDRQVAVTNIIGDIPIYERVRPSF